MLVVFHFVV